MNIVCGVQCFGFTARWWGMLPPAPQTKCQLPERASCGGSITFPIAGSLGAEVGAKQPQMQLSG